MFKDQRVCWSRREGLGKDPNFSEQYGDPTCSLNPSRSLLSLIGRFTLYDVRSGIDAKMINITQK